MTRALALSSLLDHVGFAAPRRWSGLLALNYHCIGDPSRAPGDRGTWSATADDLRSQLAFLRSHFDVVHPKDVPELQRRRRGRHAVVTFDDGSRDGYEVALPILRDLRIPGVFFITTSFADGGRVAWWDEIAWMVRGSPRTRLPPSSWVDGGIALDPDREGAIRSLLQAYKLLPASMSGDFLAWLGEATERGRCPADHDSSHWMTWDMVRSLRDSGMAIGGHTVTHPILARMDLAGQASEVTVCARRLREEIGEPMRWFAYPVGGPHSFDHHSRALLASSEVELAFSDYGGISRYDEWDRFDVRRVSVEADMVGSRFRALVRWPTLVAPPRPQSWTVRLRETARGWSSR